MKRRHFISLIGGAAAAWPLVARAQPIGKTTARIGILTGARTSPTTGPAHRAFFEALRTFGFIEGDNLIADVRWVDEDVRGPTVLAVELVQSKVDVLVAEGTEATLRAAVAAGPDIPTVMVALNTDPIARGYIKSLARPGGTVTGVFARQPELAEKQVELLAQTFPERTRLAAFYAEGSAEQFIAAERRAQLLGLQLRALKLENPPYDFDAAFRAIVQDQAQMLHVLSIPQFSAQRARIAQLAIQHRLPTMFAFRSYVEAGGLLSYGINRVPLFRTAAAYVGKILKGAKPADLPVEQPTKFELVLNLKTANAIGLELPTSILLRADEVIE
jgi:putative ABC transport system substrate-binding protein